MNRYKPVITGAAFTSGFATMIHQVDGGWIRYEDHCEAMKRIAAPSASAQQAEPAGMQVIGWFDGLTMDEVWGTKQDAIENGCAKPVEIYMRAAPAPSASPAALTDELDLIVSVLTGYPKSMARADALRAVDSIRRLLAASPAVDKDEEIRLLRKDLQQQRERNDVLSHELVTLNGAIKDMRKPKTPDGAAYAEYDKGYNKALSHVLERLTASPADQGEDARMLDWLAENEAWISWSRDHECCRVFHRDEEGDPEPIMGWMTGENFDTPRDAIRAAMSASKEGA